MFDRPVRLTPPGSDGQRLRWPRLAVGAGGDVNVSNITIASHHDGADLRVTTITRTADEQEREQRRRVKERRRQKTLDRSRRNSNPDQYEPSGRQDRAAKRRADKGLPARQQTPHGPRKVRADGKPRQAYRRDQLSGSYRQGRGAAAHKARAATIARRDTPAPSPATWSPPMGSP